MGQDQDKGFVASLASPLAAATITVGLGDRRQIQLALNISHADPIELQNEMLDRAMELLDRQAAKYDLAKEMKEFEEVALHTRNFLNAIPMADHAAKAQLETLKAELLGMEEARAEVFNKGYEAHTAGKRQGAFVPTGALKGQLNNMDNEIAKKKAAIMAVPADTAQHRQQALVNVEKYQTDLRKRRAYINDLRALAGLGEYTEFMDEQTQKV